MKRLIASLLVFITLTAGAEPFRLGIEQTETDTYITYNEKEWDFVAHHDYWSIYLARGENANINGLTVLHTLIVYDEPKKSQMSDDMIHKIFNVGLVDCQNEKIILLNDIFTDDKHKVVWVSKYPFGEFVTDVPKGSPRGKVFKLLCEGKHI